MSWSWLSFVVGIVVGEIVAFFVFFFGWSKNNAR